MQEIAKLLLSPEWWFTVVVVGLIVGVVAIYAHTGVSAALSRMSSTYRKIAERQTAKQQEKIDLLLSEPTLLTIEYIRASVRLAVACLFIILSFAAPAWQVLSRAYPEVDPANLFMTVRPPDMFAQAVLTLATMLSSFVMWLEAIFRTRLCDRARSELIGRLRTKKL